ncbi:MAG TPA: MFS transporter [Verrucomicrobiota bacterium]|nr:MFS transporter [Verrucomicrobiota bacterium]HRT10108.1 MFS transporter [Candidatus Paceibacterota bacterium]HRT59012.1 MFS transporter [Candidatus Paceibacterota bacterium]
MNDSAPTNGRLLAWQRRIFALLWGAYASYYLARVNFAVAQPAILQEFPDWTGAQIGSIPSTYALAYAVGQMVNGTLGQRFGTRRMMTLALLIASASNLGFAFAGSFAAMQVLWALNGWGQSAGWALMVHTLSEWNTASRRGTLIGRLSTSYQVGHVLSWLLAGALCDSIGWRSAFLLPGLVLLPVALVFFWLLRDSPVEAGFPPVRDDTLDAAASKEGGGALGTASTSASPSTWQLLGMTLRSRVLWILTLGFFVMNTVRYSFMNWSVQYMAEFHGRSIKNSVLTAVMIPLVGALGALVAGWASDALFGRRRAPVCVIMLLGVAATCGAMAFIPKGHWVAATWLMAVAGFMIYGPDALISGAATVDLSHPKAASIATGFTMCVGALGAIFSGAGVGYLRDLGQGNWSAVFLVLGGLSVVPALVLVSLWNARPRG